MKKKIIKVDNLANFEFWLGMFKQRSKSWQIENLKRLRNTVSTFETEAENNDKIKVLEFLLKK